MRMERDFSGCSIFDGVMAVVNAVRIMLDA